MPKELRMTIDCKHAFEQASRNKAHQWLLNEIYRLLTEICTNAEARGQKEVVEDFEILCIEPRKPLEMNRGKVDA